MAGYGNGRGRSTGEGECLRPFARRVQFEMDRGFRESAAGHETFVASGSGKYRHHFCHPVHFVLQCSGCRSGTVECTFAAAGGIVALWATGFNFSISAGIGFIALFGICIQNGVIMISDIKHNLKERLALSCAVKRKCAFPCPSGDHDGCDGRHRSDSGSRKPWHRFGVATPVGHSHHRRSGGSYFLCPVRISFDCRVCLW